MDAKRRYECCPRCGHRKRRSDCLVCRDCRTLFDRIEKRNGEILAQGDTSRSLVDIFRLVMIRGRRILKGFRRELGHARSAKEAKNASLWEGTKTQITTLLRAREERDISGKACRNARVEILQQLKREDKEFHDLCREVVKWEKSVESLQIHLAGIEKKRKEYQEKKTAEVQVEQAVA